MFNNLWKRTKEIATMYTGTFVVVMILNQLIFFGFCLNPVCLIAAMPHVLFITVVIGTWLNKQTGWGGDEATDNDAKNLAKDTPPSPNVNGYSSSTKRKSRISDNNNEQLYLTRSSNKNESERNVNGFKEVNSFVKTYPTSEVLRPQLDEASPWHKDEHLLEIDKTLDEYGSRILVTKEIVILANSVKHGKHCVAGKCVNTGEWIRPVSSVNGGELSDHQVLVKNKYGSFPVKPLQKVFMSFSKHVPLINHQPENYLISNTTWKQNFKIDISALNDMLDHPSNLWGSNSNKILYEHVLAGLHGHGSLMLIQVNDLHLFLNAYKKRRVKFKYNATVYDLPVTDPNFDALHVKIQHYQSAILTISLGESLEGYCYKIVAAIFV